MHRLLIAVPSCPAKPLVFLSEAQESFSFGCQALGLVLGLLLVLFFLLLLVAILVLVLVLLFDYDIVVHRLLGLFRLVALENVTSAASSAMLCSLAFSALDTTTRDR